MNSKKLQRFEAQVYYLVSKQNKQSKICELLIEKGLLTVPASDNIVRLTPPLIITKDDVDQAMEIINNVIKEIND